MILKVQLSQVTTHAERQVLIYDRPHEIYVETPIKAFPDQGAELLSKMGDDQRAFFDAHVIAQDDRGGMRIELLKKLPEQGW